MPRRPKQLLIVAIALLAGACASSPSGGAAGGQPSAARGTTPSADAGYGYTQEKPIRVGGYPDNGPASERAFLRTLRGPNGEPVTFVRRGSCCHFDFKGGIMGVGLLDIYEVTYPGLAKPVTLYLDMYRRAEPRIPAGFTAGPDPSAQPADARRT